MAVLVHGDQHAQRDDEGNDSQQHAWGFLQKSERLALIQQWFEYKSHL